MNRFVSSLVNLLMVFAFAIMLAPRPCLGDGYGGACQLEACACVSECSCQFAHEAEQARSGHSAHDDASSCCELPEATTDAPCHGQGTYPHFAPPDRDWYGLPFLLPTGLGLTALAPEPAVWPIVWVAKLPQPPPDKPPRLLE